MFDGVEHRLDRADLDALSLASCITVRKAQGSQFRRVVIPVVPDNVPHRKKRVSAGWHSAYV